MPYVRRAVFLLFFASAAFAEVVIVGSSSFGCETEILSQEPVQYEPTSHEEGMPSACQDFSGTWEGACHGAAMKCPRVTELGDCIMPRPDEVYLDNIFVPDLEPIAPPTDRPWHRITITQQGCESLGIQGPQETFFSGNLSFDLTKDTRGAGFIRFRRTCEITSPRPAKWRRTYDMALRSTLQPRWSSSKVVGSSNDFSGIDKNYNAQYRKVAKWRLYQPKGDSNVIRVDYGYWFAAWNYDPAALEFYNPDFGGMICLWKRVGN